MNVDKNDDEGQEGDKSNHHGVPVNSGGKRLCAIAVYQVHVETIHRSYLVFMSPTHSQLKVELGEY